MHDDAARRHGAEECVAANPGLCLVHQYRKKMQSMVRIGLERRRQAVRCMMVVMRSSSGTNSSI